MTMMTREELGEPEIVQVAGFAVTGPTAEYTMERTQEIPQQWSEFVVELEAIEQVPRTMYGVVRGERGRPMRYTCGIAAGSLATVPAGWETMELPARSYAIFKGKGGVAEIRRMWPAIWQVWFPLVEKTPAEGPMVEVYAAGFTAAGGPFEIRIPYDAG